MLSIGLSVGLGFEKLSNQQSLDYFISTLSFVFGIIFIILGFHVKKDIENTITNLNL
ncbi:hypothetical protein [Aurantibacter aestuarii]|uniref:hypothetical protein n=1 Tax=Aurantibacter aestuarii TaxID=1266046 RepID=UPI0015E62F3B|nr:hypothetical protein [Aurantibacter aestuarii]